MLEDAVREYVKAKNEERYESEKASITILADLRKLQNFFYTTQIGSKNLNGKSAYDFLKSSQREKPKFGNIDPKITAIAANWGKKK